MKTSTFLIAAALLLPRVVHASSWAALDEVPIRTGELRVAKPQAETIGFPLQRVNAKARVDGVVATVTVEQVFENPFDDAIEAVYLFPMSTGAAVHGYEIQIGERVVRGEIAERDAARRRYEAAKRSGRTAALVESEKPNVFTQSVANIPPRSPIRVRFSYVEQLSYEDGGYELVFPLVVGPRYLPSSTSDPRPIGGQKYGDSGARGTLSVQVAAGVPIVGLESPSHPIQQRTVDETTRQISLSSPTKLDRDFVLRWKTAGNRTYAGLMTHRTDEGGFFNLIIQPKLSYETEEITAREVVFLIDRSGSMAGIPMSHARRVARGLIDGLSPRDTFNVIAFSDSAMTFARHPVSATAEKTRAAKAWIANLYASGGTQLLDGVGRALLKKPRERRVRHVIVVTDGEVGNDDEILNAVARYASHNRIFPVGVGASPNRYLLDRLGADSRGFASYVAVGEAPEAVVERVARRTSRPYLTGLEIDWRGLSVSDVEPKTLPDVYAGKPLVVSGRYEKPTRGTVHLLGRIGGRSVDLPLKVDLNDAKHHEGVALVWAKRRIDTLLASDPLRSTQKVKRAVTKIGLRFGLVTDYTSYVAVDPEGPVSDGAPMVLSQTLDRPANQQDAQPAVAAYRPPPPPNSAPAPAPRRRRSWGGGGGGGGDLDPITITTMITSLPLAWQLRRRRSKKERTDETA